MVHQCSDHSAGPFLIANCVDEIALLESSSGGVDKDVAKDLPGAFAQAKGGTLVLDEIGALSLALQGQVLDMIGRIPASIDPNGKIPGDVRIIALTNRNLRQMQERGQFLAELYSLISAVPVYVPPLREHTEDLPLLIKHFLAKLNKPGVPKPNAVSPEFLEILENYDFPENIRELEGVITHALLLATGPILTLDTIPARLVAKAEIDALAKQGADQGWNLKQAKALATERMESKLIRRVLSQSQGNFSMAARKLGISRSALYYKIKKYKIDIEQ
jgi:DNA-binding NtrC family response regulator